MDELDPAITRALTVRSPWWWFIFNGKDVENRNRRISFRGTIYIHSGLFFDRGEVHDSLQIANRIARSEQGEKFVPPQLRDFEPALGCLVGIVRIVACVERHPSPWFFGRYGYVLADARPLPKPIPCTGAQGLFIPKLKAS